jgi:hypothetical protein
MDTLSQAITKYRELLEKGDNLLLIDTFYAEDMVQVENNGKHIEGKKQILDLELKNIGSVNGFRQEINNLLIDEQQGIVMGEMTVYFDSKKMGKMKLQEAFIQKWAGNKIIYQKFYYKDFQDAG